MNDMNDDVEQLLRSAGRRPAIPAARAARMKANVRDAWKTELRARRVRSATFIAIPLAAAAVLAMIFIVAPSMRMQSQPAIAPVAIATVERLSGSANVGTVGTKVNQLTNVTTAADGRIALRLADGSSLRVDHDTRVRLASAKRFELTSGTIYVDAAHSGLEVVTPYGVVRDIGTKFEVRLAPDMARVRVRDGVIDLAGRRAAKGEQLRVHSDGSTDASRVPTWGEDWAWTATVAPPFAIDGRRVAELVQWVSSESGLTVRYASRDVETKANAAVLHGNFGDLPPTVAADAVLPTAGLRADVREGVMTVRQQ